MKKKIFHIIDFAVLSAAGILLIFQISPAVLSEVFHTVFHSRYFLLIVSCAFMSYILKAFRIYVILLERWNGFGSFLQTYTTMTCVGLILPFNLGDLYRSCKIYNRVHNSLSSILVVVIDRFFDTIPLICVFIVSTIYSIPVVKTMIFVIGFFVTAYFAYILYSPCYEYVNHYLIISRSTPFKINVLKVGNYLEEIRRETGALCRGRGIILILFSFISWFFEIGTIAFIAKSMDMPFGLKNFIGYLNAGFMGEKTQYVNTYLILGILLMFTLSILLRIYQKVKIKMERV